ncbi:hypothetical protein ABKN59_002731 [Abortiporus biennis]
MINDAIHLIREFLRAMFRTSCNFNSQKYKRIGQNSPPTSSLRSSTLPSHHRKRNTMFPIVSSVLLFTSLVSALTVETPTNWTTGNQVVATWSTTAGDPSVFSFELSNPTIFNAALGIANNVDVTLGSISLTLPIVPATTGYTLQAVNITDINQVFVSAASTLSSVATVVPTISGATTTSTSGFGTTISNTSPAASNTASSTGTSSSNTGSATPTSFNGNNSGALGLNQLASASVLILGAIIGGMMVL